MVANKYVEIMCVSDRRQPRTAFSRQAFFLLTRGSIRCNMARKYNIYIYYTFTFLLKRRKRRWKIAFPQEMFSRRRVAAVCVALPWEKGRFEGKETGSQSDHGRPRRLHNDAQPADLPDPRKLAPNRDEKRRAKNATNPPSPVFRRLKASYFYMYILI